MDLPPLFKHQVEHIEKHADDEIHALLWEQGSAKTRPTIESVAKAYRDKRIDALVVVTDDGIHSNWAVTEVPTWMPRDIPYRIAEYHSRRATTKTHKAMVEDVLHYRGLAVLCMTWDAVMTEAGKKVLWRFLKHRKVFYVADETSALKTPGAKRTIRIVSSAVYAVMRRILNGTPVELNPLDVYSQFRFLDPDFWKKKLGIDSFTAFKAEFASYQHIDMGPKGSFEKLTGFKNIPALKACIQTVSSRVLKEDVLDLPPKIYTPRYVTLSPEQERVYDKLKLEAMADVGEEVDCDNCEATGQLAYGDGDGVDCPMCWGSGRRRPGMMIAELPIVRMLRMQQVLCGYQTALGEPIEDLPGPNPRLEALEHTLCNTQRPHIVCGRFQRDIDKIMALGRDLGLRCADYDGRTSPENRTKARLAFQAGELDLFVGNPAAMARGITLTMARTMVTYSQSWRRGHRWQVEDRVHRGGLDHSITYIDLIARYTIDEEIVKAIRDTMDIASQVTGDKLREWLTLSAA